MKSTFTPHLRDAEALRSAKRRTLRWFPALLCFLLLPLGGFGQLPTPTYGWNMGNTLEPPNGEGTWGPAASQALINTVAASGFNVVRLPVAWNSHADQSTYQIDPAWMARVKQVVDWCYERNLTVIVNCHWDGGWLERNITDTVDPIIDAKMRSYWTQIATVFEEYDDRLLFAGTNEPDAETAAQWTTLLAYHQTFVNAVRATGGNNSNRWLVIQGPRTDIDLTDQLVSSLPSDSASGRLAFEVHYYSPFSYTLQSQDEWWGKMFYFWGQGYHHPTRTDRNASFQDEAYLDAQFQKMADKFVSQGIPVIIGEFAAMKRTGQSDLTGTDLILHLASRTHFHKYVVDSANARGLKPIYWDIAGLMFDWSTGAITDSDTVRALTGGPALSPSGKVEEEPTPTVPEYGWAPFTAGQAGSWTPSGSWVEPGLQYSATGLPAWAAIDGSTGVISGTPTGAASTYIQATISVSSGGQSRGRMKLNLVVASPGSDLAPVNLSTRGRVGLGEQALVPGFVVGGDTPRSFLIRAVGPTIAEPPYNVGGVLADPTLTIFDEDGAVLRVNDDWGSGVDRDVLDAAFGTAGAFDLNADSKDAALLVTLDPGLYTARAAGAGEGTGVALVEFYDVTGGASGGTLLNISTRALVGTGNEVLIPGLVFRGGGTKRLLVRAIGPTLTQYDVQGVLANPEITLLKDGVTLAANDDWSVGTDAAEIEAVSASVGAFALPAESRDAVLLTTLAEGAYTVILHGVGDTSGIALLEVYLVP